MNRLLIVGKVSRATESLTSTKGAAYKSFTVDVANPFRDWPDRVKCLVFGKYAEDLPPLAVGRLVSVCGRASAEAWIGKKNQKPMGGLTLSAEYGGIEQLDGDGDVPATTETARQVSPPADVAGQTTADRKTLPTEDDSENFVPF